MNTTPAGRTFPHSDLSLFWRTVRAAASHEDAMQHVRAQFGGVPVLFSSGTGSDARAVRIAAMSPHRLPHHSDGRLAATLVEYVVVAPARFARNASAVVLHEEAAQ